MIVAFDGDDPADSISKNLDSIKEALNNHEKIFVELDFIYILE